MARRFFTLQQAVDMIMADDGSEDQVDICILPPNDGAKSECEHVDEDDLAPVGAADVCGEVEVFSKIYNIEPVVEDV